MSFFLFFKLKLAGGQQPKELLQNEFVLLLNYLTDGSCSELHFVLFDHKDQPLDLLLILLPDLLIALDLKLQTFCLVNPVNPLGPRNSISSLLEDLMKLLLSRRYFLLLCVYNQIIIFCQNGNQGILFVLNTPGQLLKKVKKFLPINSISFG